MEGIESTQNEALTQKLDSYLRKYENFSNHVTNYLQQKQVVPLEELVSPHRALLP